MEVRRKVIAAVEKFCDELYNVYSPESEEDMKYYLDCIDYELSSALVDLAFDIKIDIAHLNEDVEF